MTPEDAERLRIIQSTDQDLDRWSGRQKIQPESPQKGSDLHDDDKGFPPTGSARSRGCPSR